MKKKSAKVRSTVTKALDLPGDILLDQPRLVLDGFHALHMENHKGITEYSGERLCMKVQGGSVCITGRNLVLKELGFGQIALSGRIFSVEWKEAGR